MSNIFVSYRRSDSAGHTGRLMDELENQFPRSQIFRDVEGIEAGADFVQAIENAVGQSLVLLAVIGPRWLSASNEKGERRLHSHGDFVRHEIAAALRRNIRVIPVLVDGAAPPPADELPQEIAALARRQAHELSERRWDYDIEQLLGILGKVPGLTRQPRLSMAPVSRTPISRLGGGRFRSGIALGAGGGALVVAVALVFALRGKAAGESTDPVGRPTVSVTSKPVESAPPEPVEPVEPVEPANPPASAAISRLKLNPQLFLQKTILSVGKNENVGDGAWPVYETAEQVGGNGAGKLCRVRPKESVTATCKHERTNAKRVSLVVRVESDGCTGFVSSDAFLRAATLPQSVYKLPRCQ